MSSDVGVALAHSIKYDGAVLVPFRGFSVFRLYAGKEEICQDRKRNVLVPFRGFSVFRHFSESRWLASFFGES